MIRIERLGASVGMAVRAGLMVVATAVLHLSVLPAPALGAEGDPAAGEALSATCVACHGQDGHAQIEGYPHLAGQNERYLFTQLELIQTQDRPVPLMQGMLDGMSKQDLRDLAAYYASLEARVGQAADERLDLGERIYRGGLAEKGVAACSACHSPTGSGNALAGFPRLSGQAVEYLVTQLTEFREGRRQTDDEYGGMMRDIAHGLTDTEIEAVANYVHGLH